MLGLKIDFQILLLGWRKVVSRLGLSIVRGPLEGGGGEGLEEAVFSGEAPSYFFLGGLSYVGFHVVSTTVLTEIILISSMEEEGPCKDV